VTAMAAALKKSDDDKQVCVFLQSALLFFVARV
jgi:hypothetical protein